MFKICAHPAVASRFLVYKQCGRNVVVPQKRWISAYNASASVHDCNGPSPSPSYNGTLAVSLSDRRGCSFSTTGRSSSRPLPPPDAPPGPPRLFDLAIQKSFKRVKERVQTHPYEASYRHPRRWTALHCVVEYGAPIDVIQAVYEAYPEALHATDYQGRTPQEVALFEDAKQFLKELQAAKSSTSSSSSSSVVSTATTTSPNPDTLVRPLLPEEIQRIILHADTLSEQVSIVTATCLKLQSEVDELKQRLTKLT
eukprot:CAMPEP_0198295876 /NCGR_PEP_ID=MMETSP1449-20131203/30120_1 /TAXON_ID=420275 /ORGANISM="Attheya septentrionalis, Strain CCMP2084" /LENGTH=253 /DNA_ID=CAMNT_0043996309 /DNA_START=14 /DNA_END=775 /DNA_ORIENTATION=-